MLREIVLDTETTGLDPKDGHRVIELGCIELVNYIPTGLFWHWHFNPERDIPKAATDVHGLTTAFLADKPLFASVADDFLDVIRGARLIIHNAAFDIAFLNAELQRLKRAPILMDQVIDTLAVARRKHPGGINSLDGLCRRYNIDNSIRTKHGALLDSELLAGVYLRLMGAEQAGLELAMASIDKTGLEIKAAAARAMRLPSRLSSDERQAHLNFIETLGQAAIWRDYNASDAVEPLPKARPRENGGVTRFSDKNGSISRFRPDPDLHESSKAEAGLAAVPSA